MVRCPGRGGTVEEEDDDDYQSRMDDPPEYVIAAITRRNERERSDECATGTARTSPSSDEFVDCADACKECESEMRFAVSSKSYTHTMSILWNQHL
jgi:hypothetical protein